MFRSIPRPPAIATRWKSCGRISKECSRERPDRGSSGKTQAGRNATGVDGAPHRGAFAVRGFAFQRGWILAALGFAARGRGMRGVGRVFLAETKSIGDATNFHGEH